MSRLTEINIMEILENGALDRNDICKILKIPWTTAYDHLRRLKSKNLVECFEEENRNKRGRKKKYWKLIVLNSTIYHLEQELQRLKGDPIEELIFDLNILKKKEGKSVKLV